ncbi:hypothetical protein [Methylobacterium nigriterrae]|uniref:hypothetical protein n=1 Tax=Methylobacterium nigriterrae TaxID=3127512 RepID=UPI003013A8B0
MAVLEIEAEQVEVLAAEAYALMNESLARQGCDEHAFWHAVSLIYRRGLPSLTPEPAPETISIAA